MALRTIRIGSSANVVQYDDAVYGSAVETDQPMKAGVPVDPNDVVRLSELGSYIAGPASAVDSNLAEFDGITGKVIKDGGLAHVDAADAISKKHTQGTDTSLGSPFASGGVDDFRYAAAIADDGIKALPTIATNYAAKVEVIVSSEGIIDANATFMIDSTGTVTPQYDSGNCVYNVDTDAKLCIGTAAAQNPLTIKYRLGSAVAKIMITMMYVKA